MAEFINDSGAYSQDATFSGTKGTDYDFNETNKLVWFSGTGTASTGFTLPDSPFIVYEVYDPDTGTYANDLGGTIVRSKVEFTTDIGTIGTTLNAWYDIFEAATAFTEFKIRAVHYKGNDVADVYFADESTTNKFLLTGGTEDGVEDAEFTAHSSTWSISDELLVSLDSTIYGPNMIVGGDFATAADFTDNWTTSALVATWDNTYTSSYITNPSVKMVADDTLHFMQYDFENISPKTPYRFSIDVDMGDAEEITIWSVNKNAAQLVITTSGTHTVEWQSTSRYEDIRIYVDKDWVSSYPNTAYCKNVKWENIEPELDTELNANATFDSNITTWETNVTLAWQTGGYARFTLGSSYGWMGQTLIETIESGTNYRCRVKIHTAAGPSANVYTRFYDSIINSYTPMMGPDSEGYYFYDFTGNGGYNDYTRLYMSSGAADDYCELDEFSLKEIL